MSARERWGERLLRLAVWALAAVIFLVSIYPLIWAALAALKTGPELRANLWGLPEEWRWENLREVLEPEYGLVRAFLNSVLVTTAAVLLTTALAAAAGYAASRLRFRGSRVLFYIFILGMMIPIHVTLIPLHQLIVTQLGLSRHVWAVLGPYVGFALPVGIFLFRGFFTTAVPRELEEAAAVDGASRWQIFSRVALPLAKPAAATVAVFTAVSAWNEYAFALVLLEGKSACTLPLALANFSDGHAAEIQLIAAALLVTIAPVLLFYALASRQIISGLTAGAVRG